MTLLQKRLEQFRRSNNQLEGNFEVTTSSSTKNVVWKQVKDLVIQAAIDEFDITKLDDQNLVERSKYVSQQVSQLVEKAVKEMDAVLTRGEQHRLVGEVVSEIVGYGPITQFLDDRGINEIMVNGAKKIYVERQGKIELTEAAFRDDTHLLNIIERIVAPLGKRIDDASPTVDARLPDGSRVNAVIPPVSLNGPTLTIRKFSAVPFTMSDLIRFNTVSSDIAAFLKACVKGRLNIIVGGGTGSGKTSTLNVLSSFIPNDERIVTIEDAAELKLQQEHVVRLEARPPNIEGKGRISIRDLVINSLRMRPDRIVVGEVRGGEALDMLQAMNTGHEGSLTTGHANSPRDLLARIETMVLMAGVELPIRAIREQVASALDFIIFQSRLKDGGRKVTKVTEVLGMEGDVITLQDIFVFEQRGLDEDGKVLGNFRATGVIPKCLPTLEARGIHLPISIFS